MDARLSDGVMGIQLTSTRGLLLSKPYEPHYSTSKINGAIERKDSFAIPIKNYGKYILLHANKITKNVSISVA